jgi:hypothetical protein
MTVLKSRRSGVDLRDVVNPPQQVFVVMGNDYPDAVFTDGDEAEAYCAKKRREKRSQGHIIYWNLHEFTLDAMRSNQSENDDATAHVQELDAGQ